MNINIYARASSMTIDDATCNLDHLPLTPSPPLRRFPACIPRAFTSLVTKPYLHPSRRHLFSSRQASSVDPRSPLMLRFHSSALGDCRFES